MSERFARRSVPDLASVPTQRSGAMAPAGRRHRRQRHAIKVTYAFEAPMPAIVTLESSMFLL